MKPILLYRSPIESSVPVQLWPRTINSAVRQSDAGQFTQRYLVTQDVMVWLILLRIQLAMATVFTPFEEGVTAAETGMSREDNPYQAPPTQRLVRRLPQGRPGDGFPRV